MAGVYQNGPIPSCFDRTRAGPLVVGALREKEKTGGCSYFLPGSNFTGSTTYQTLPNPWPVTSPRFWSLTQ